MTTHLLLLLFIPEAWSSVLRVETGHQPIAIEGRDMYMGYFTKVHFDSPTCIGGLIVHCLRPLTGAEEIDLLYTPCPKGHWRVAHYMNTKEEFRLKAEITAKQLLIASREPLTIIDVQVISCMSLSSVNVSCHEVREHPHRHSHPDTLRAHDTQHIRRKRAVTSANDGLDFEPGSQVVFENDKIVPRGATMTVQQGSVLRFADGVSLIVNGALSVRGSKDAPVRFERLNSNWNGISIIHGSPASSLKYLNISGANGAGLTITGGTPPTLENVISDSNEVGFRIESNSSEVRATKLLALNNRGAGFVFFGKGSIILDTCTAAANRGYGFHIQRSNKVRFIQPSCYSNSRAAIFTQDVNNIRSEDSVISGNWAGYHITKRVKGKSIITLVRQNISGHHYGPAFLLEDDIDTDLKIASCLFYDNYKGAFKCSGHYEGTIEIRDTNFTRNRGPTLTIDSLHKGSVKIEKCNFHQNQLNDYPEAESVLEVSTDNLNDYDANASIIHCEFTKNIMNDVILFTKQSGNDPNILLDNNDIRGNLARNVISYNTKGVVIKENFLYNAQSSCEIMVPHPSFFNSAHTFWGYASQAEIRERICTTTSTDVVTARNVDDAYKTNPNIVNNPLPPFDSTYNLVRALPTPYTVDSDIIITQTIMVEPGTQFLFGPNAGITIQERGKLILNGTSEEPITISSTGVGAWRGITVKPDGDIEMNHVTLNDPAVGVWLDSSQFSLDNVVINKPNVHGVEVTTNAGPTVDLGGTTITGSVGTALAVDERNQNLTLKNFQIENAGISGVDFAAPSGNISIENARIINSGSHGIHISEYSQNPLNSVTIRNVTLKDQRTGHAGLLISGGWVSNIDLERIHAEGNVVPSIMLALECNDKPSMTTIADSTFVDNRDTVVSLQLGECGGLQLERNLFDRNNADGRGGTVRVDTEPNPGLENLPVEIVNNDFSANGGDFVVFLSSDGEHKIKGNFSRNRLNDNAVSQAAVIVASPFFNMQGNRFENPKTQYQLEPRGDGSWILNATGNWWGTEDLNQISQTVKAPEGSVRIQPILRTGETWETVDSTVTSSPSVIVPVLGSGFDQCAHLNYCSHRGSCAGNLCLCPEGYGGGDCSLLIGCPNNCSHNGQCNLFHVCNCVEGWKGQDCSTPICTENCGNHGKCVSKDECECDELWTGEFCLEPACTRDICFNGQCENKQCVCEGPWRGRKCDIPVCTTCSLNGQCVAPEQCECFADWGGSDCNTCVGSSCSSCDMDCDHGNCDEVTRTCTCAQGWSGAACDVCGTACSTTGRIMTILPQAADRDNTNTVVTVFGSELPQTNNAHYYCVYGSYKVVGIRESSSIIRCPVPENMTANRYSFHLTAGPNELTGTTLHFTAYDSCNPSYCQGSCIGPLCICPAGKTGVFCDVVEPIPEIDRHLLNNQQANTAVEGTPYVIHLPTMPGTVLRFNSTISDLRLDSAKGLLEWPDPVGQASPHEITVTAHSLSGESTMSWNVTVQPSYTATVEEVSTEGNKLIFRGRAQGERIKQMPITLKVRHADGNGIEELTTTTDNEGNFTYAYIPVDSGEYIVSASHPGEESSDQKEFRVLAQAPPTISEENDQFVIEVPGEENCNATSLPAGSGDVTATSVGNGLRIEVRPHFENEFFVLVNCNVGKELIRIPQRGQHQEKAMLTYPQELQLFQDITTRLSPPVEIKAYPQEPLTSPIEVVRSDHGLNIINTFPNTDDLNAINRDGISIVIQMDVSEENRGNISIISNKEELARIPYSISSPSTYQKSGHLRLSVCIRDEFYGQTQSDPKIVASLSFINLQIRVDQTQNNVVINGPPAIFDIQEGFYQMIASSAEHDTLSRFVQVSNNNVSFCFDLRTSSPVVASLADGNWTGSLITKPNGRLPYLQFDPPAVTERSATDVLVTVKGEVPGVLSVENTATFQSRVQSIQLNDSFWATTMPTLDEHANARCSAFLLPVNFDFLADGAAAVAKSSSNLVVKKENANSEHQILCDSSGNGVATGSVTKVLCNCGEGMKSKCRQEYTSATACGSSWSRIPDDTVSLQVLATFLLLISDCKGVQVNFDELNEVLTCVSSLEDKCPGVETRRKRQNDMEEEIPAPGDLPVEEQMQNDGPASIINRISQVQGVISPAIQPMLSIFNAIDMQSYRAVALYQDFFQLLKKVVPVNITSRTNVQAFVAAIGEKSEKGTKISEEEFRQINDDELANLWNDTATVWTSGKMDKQKGIQFEDAKKLVEAADKLKSFSRQNGTSDPFAALHNYLGKLLQTPSSSSQKCADATVYIEPYPIYEVDTIKVRVFLTNTKDIPMVSPSLSFDSVLPMDGVTPEANVVQSGIGVNPNAAAGVLNPGESLETVWQKRIENQKPLTTIAKYQPVITLSFSSGGRLTKQRLSAPVLEVNPVRSAKIVHFIYPAVGTATPFSIATSIMNIGYSTLENVRVQSYEMIVANSNGEHLPYKLQNVRIDKQPVETALSFDGGTIPSGQSKMITFNISTESVDAKIISVKCFISVNDQSINIQEMSTYIVEAAAGKNGFMVKDKTGAHFFFRPESGTLVNIVPLTFVTSRSSELSDPDRKIIVADFKNEESRSFTGYLWGTMDYPNNIPVGYQLVKVTEKANGRRDRQLRPITWKESSDLGDKLNFIDSGFMSTPYSISYEYVFADPTQFSVPQFDQSSYRIQMVPEMWWPTPPAMVGQIAAESDDGAEVEYSLYSPDNSRQFSVDEHTGGIIVEEPVEPGKEICLVMVARDSRGQESRVPVAINTGGSRQECYLFNTEGLHPSVSHWPVLPTVLPPTDSGVITASTLPTGQPPTEPTPTNPDDVPTPPDFVPLTEPTEIIRTLPTDSHPWTESPVTEEPYTPETTQHTVIVVTPTSPWTTPEVPSPPTDEPTSATELVSPDHSPSTVVTEPTIETELSTARTELTTNPEDNTTPTSTTETTEIYTITPDVSPGTLTTAEADTTLEDGTTSVTWTITGDTSDTTTPTSDPDLSTTAEIIWTRETESPWTVSPSSEPVHSISPDYTLPTNTPTAETVTMNPSTSELWTIEPPMTAISSNTIGGRTDRPVTQPTEPSPTDDTTDACKRNAVPLYNLICELIAGQDCSTGWNILVVTATTNRRHLTIFIDALSMELFNCNQTNQALFVTPQINNSDDCEFSSLKLGNITNKTAQIINQSLEPFTANALANSLYSAAQCAHQNDNNKAGIAYFLMDMDCDDACSSSKLLNCQGYFIDTLIHLRYIVNIIASDLPCYKDFFQQCEPEITEGSCRVVDSVRRSGNEGLCNNTDYDRISTFEMAFSLSFIVFLLLVIVIINVILICQKQKKVQDAYENLRMKHFPNANEYIDTSRKQRRDDWEIDPGKLEVFNGEKLGTGAFAVVLKGRLTGRRPVDDIIKALYLKSDHTDEVAVKRPPPYAVEAAKQDFQEEIRFMKKLGYHTHILGMIGCVTSTDVPMIVMQYCEHGDLLHFLNIHRGNFGKEDSVLSPKELLSIAWQISDGLCYLHSLEFIHRDLAARNVLLTGDLTAKISDFGLCRQPRVTDENSIYVSKGGRLPVKWMAPESLEDYIFSFSSDVWSFGVTLWEMFSLGEPPYPKVNGGAMYDVLETGERLPKLDEMTDEIYGLMQRCWEWKPEERASIEDLRKELHMSLSSSSVYYGYLSMPQNVNFDLDDVCEVEI